MSLVFSEEQRILKDTAKEFVAEHAPVAALRKLRDDVNPDGFDRSLWHAMTELGWPGVLVDEAYGGVEFGFKGLGAVLEETGRTLTASPLLSTALIGATLIGRLGTETQKKQWLGKIASGEMITALAFEESPHHAPERVALQATATPEGYVLDGSKGFVLDGHVADLLLVVARTSGASDETNGISVFAVPADAPGVAISRTFMVDSRNAANLTLSRVPANDANLLGGPAALGKARFALDYTLDLARIGLCAEMLGSLSEAFDRTMDYLKTREQFGALIGSFQGLKHRAAEMFSEIELSRSVVMEALDAVERDDDDLPLLASLAKAKVSDTFHTVSSEAIQMHGGIGMTDDEEIGFFIKRARVAEQTFGDAKYHRNRYARLSGF